MAVYWDEHKFVDKSDTPSIQILLASKQEMKMKQIVI